MSRRRIRRRRNWPAAGSGDYTCVGDGVDANNTRALRLWVSRDFRDVAVQGSRAFRRACAGSGVPLAGEFGREEGVVSEEELVRVDRTEREDDDSEK